MSAHNFINVLREHEIAHLWASIYVIDRLKGVSVPESDASVGSTTTWCEEAILMRTPADSFDGCSVIGELG